LLDGPAQGGVAFEALDANEPVPGVGPASPPEADLPPRQSDLGGDLGIALAVKKAKRMMAARCRSWDDAVGAF